MRWIHRNRTLATFRRVLELQTTVIEQLKRRVEELERTVPGRCGWCGRKTDSLSVFFCQEGCKRQWDEKRAA